ncbi:hypothetical protein C9374_012960 [Naegleria lovaniensis]|uniref:Right handed beta helix domain-containing protein n=1 Tax=Naegleria lovaniensis TaxID=51637 RepID=A0AA88GCB3_NAELO|nr:uncharacterized protein C9374_012960 [Naegleria lovaniensis]KAG2373017.1 hypothetical protein C9374_012960 [Naegleria lovaniensis]
MLDRLIVAAVAVVVAVLFLSILWSSHSVHASNSTFEIHLFVSPTKGNDLFSGNSTQFPFATLDKASSMVTLLKNSKLTLNTSIYVNLMPGTFYLNSTLVIPRPSKFNDQFSPVTWRPIPGSSRGDVNITGGISLPPYMWKKVTLDEHASIYEMLPLGARGKVYQCNLTLLSPSVIATPFKVSGRMDGKASAGSELFFRDFPQTVARYPNKLNTQYESNPSLVLDVYMKTASKGTNSFLFNSTSCPNKSKWSKEQNGYAFGYWKDDYSDSVEGIQNIDANGTVVLRNVVADGSIASGSNFYLVNFLSELDQAGEYILQDNVLYFWPPAPIEHENDVVLSLTETLVQVNAHAQIFDSLEFGFVRGNAIYSWNSHYIVVNNSIISNVGAIGLSLLGCRNCLVTNNEIFQIGKGGVIVTGPPSDRAKLIPSNNFISNNLIHSFSRVGKVYRPAVRIEGVGAKVTHNYFFNGDHAALMLIGNNHEVSFNKIHDVVKTSDDAGAIYMGRDWTTRGNVVKYNFIYRVRGLTWGAACIYLDDVFSSAIVFGNVLYDCNRGVIVGGGRHNQVQNNIFIRNWSSIRIDARGLQWNDDEWRRSIWNNLWAVPFNSSLWEQAYPELARILDGNPFEPFGNVVSNNLVTESFTANHVVQPYTDMYSVYTNNTFNVSMSIFMNVSELNFNLIPGNIYEGNWTFYNFTKIPFDDIGLLSEKREPIPPPPPPRPSPKPSLSPKKSLSNNRPLVSMSKRSVSKASSLGRLVSNFKLMTGCMFVIFMMVLW